MVKVKDIFAVLEDDSLTKSSQLPKSMSKTMQLFHRDKAKSDGSIIHTNMRVLHTEEMQIILCDLRYELEELYVTLGLKRAQHHAVVKLGSIGGMIEKIDVQEWSDRLTKLLF